MATKVPSTDYETYTEIMEELLRPISGEGLDVDTLRRLYESKLVYLENLRLKCFREVNANPPGHFSQSDYQLILEAAKQTKAHLKDLMLVAISTHISRRKIV